MRRGRDDGPPPRCEAQTSCDACTPILGCGWCQYEDGSGSCATGPEACKQLAFRWNWEPVACPATGPSDGGVAPVDAPPTGDASPATDAGPADTGVDLDTAPAADAACKVRAGAPVTCAPTAGGTLCPADRYTLGCHDAAAPDPTWGCSKAYGSGTEVYYCCPCGA